MSNPVPRDSVISRIRYLLTGRLSSSSTATNAAVVTGQASPDDAGVTHLGGTNSRLLTMEANTSGEPDLSTVASAGPAIGTPGQVVGPYRIKRPLGKGGMGEVFEAEEIDSGRPVALKVLSRSLGNPAAVARFLREGRLAATISHPNSVYVYASQEIDGVPIIAMELVPGGTVESLVERAGPMSPAHAVDATLQIIAGLEAAHAMGVLHRDVKPSNCFIDASGMVKVGDYGLSMSTISSGHSTQLTMQGTFLGTPAYASPEQVSGAEVDVRSDIYATGATLYFLLTGRTPFAHAGMMQVFAAVLREDPASPRVHVPAVPEALAEVVLRSLRKDPAARYTTYADLRQALRPFSSTTAGPAPLRLRFLSWLIDFAVMLPVGLVASTQSFRAGVSSGASGVNVSARALPSLWVPLTAALVASLYYGVLEGRWGAALGKRVCGLRVVGREQTPPGVVRALIRTLTVTLVTNLGSIFIYARYGVNPDLPPSLAAWLAPLNVLLAASLWVTARKRNGFRGVHEWISGTRTVRPVTERRMAVMPAAAPAAGVPLGESERIGEYVCEARLWSDEEASLISARDTALRRSVWIHRVPPGTPPATVARQSLARETRLRLLATVRSDQDRYDVYEAVPGAPISSSQPWHVVRSWLMDLSSELGAALVDGTLPPSLSIDQVWVTPAGGVRLLDIPTVRTSSASAGPLHDVASAQAFLHRLADRACRVPAEAPGGAQLPRSAQSVIDALGRQTYKTMAEVRAALESTTSTAASVSRVKRLGSLAPAAVAPVLLLFGVLVAAFWMYQVRSDPTLDALSRQLAQLARMDSQTPPNVNPAEREAFRIAIGDRFGNVIAAPDTWSRMQLLPRKPAAERARQAALAVSSTDRARARADAQQVIDALDRLAAARLPFWQSFASNLAEGFCLALAVQGVIAIVLAVFLRAPAGLRLLGFTVAVADGSAATRARVAWRGLVAWSPVIVATIASLTVNRLVPNSDFVQGLIGALGLLIFLGGLAWTISVPTRGPQDRLAGTVVVPQ